jgi:hypothetical protein
VQARLRTTALLGVGALVVHELRYRIAFGGSAQSALATTGHGYLGVIAPAVALLAMLGLASLAHRIASADASAGTRRGRIWLTLTLGLVGIFCMQELLEALFATGHPEGFDGVFGDGGWLAIPLAMAASGVALAFIHLAAASAFHGVATSYAVFWPSATTAHSRPFESPRRRPPLLRHLAGRAPPLFA